MQKDIFTNLSMVLLAIGIFLMYILGVLWPDVFWSTHFFAFLPPPLQFGSLAIIAILIGRIYYKKETSVRFDISLNKSQILIISTLMSLVFYKLNIVNDYYGDAKNFSPYLETTFTHFKPGFWSELCRIEFTTGHARWGVFNLYSAIAYSLNLNMLQTFQLMEAIFGGGFVYLWLSLVARYSKQQLAKIVLVIIGCTAPTILNFCGHIETYALVLFLIIGWLYIFIKALEDKHTFALWMLIPMTLICIRFNTPSIVLLPALLLAFIQHYGNNHKYIQGLFSLKGIGIFVLIPIIILGILSYFFLFESHIDSRILDDQTNDIDRLFLPLFSPEAPLNTYNLFSWNHISDIVMSLFFWSPGLLFLFGVSWLNRKQIQWYPTTLLLLLTVLLFLGFLFMINPLMSLPMDWDLYTLPFPIVLVCLLFMLKDIDTLNTQTWNYAFVLHILSIPTFIVLSNQSMHSYRIESVGIRVYKTYYQHADSYLLYALQMLDDKALYISRKERLLQKLKPHIIKGIDQNYAALLLDEGINNFADKNYTKARYYLLAADSYAPHLTLTHEFIEKTNKAILQQGISISEAHKVTSDSLFEIGLKHSRIEKRYADAITIFEKAAFYNPYNLNIDLLQMEAYFYNKDYNKALILAEKLVQQQFPNQKQAIRFAIHCALEAAAYKNALTHTDHYMSLWPEDTFIKGIQERLKNNDQVSQLKFKFAKTQK